VHYQPQFDLRSRELTGVEALVRWSGPEGLMSPACFMTELERARAMMPLLQFVINNASRDMARWVRRHPNLNVSINSSATDLEDADLVQIMRDVLSMWNVDPSQLTLEITETSLMRDPKLGIDTLSRLRELGVRTSIDDFGTGYSSLEWLKNLPVDELKIDQSFVKTVIDDQRDRKIVESVIELAHAMELSVVAEGIESEGVMHVLREAGCDIGQGYFFSQPLTGAEFEKGWLSGGKVREGVA
jgi:EAL domain-containing protein (putative c-di-GMP-specific phosphodiesterase class I)